MPSGSDAHNSDTHDRLDGWKAIAAFLGKSVRTVQRWEKEFGLPVRRLGHERGETVFASQAELTAWLEERGHTAPEAHAAQPAPDPAEDRPPEAPHSRWPRGFVILAGGLLTVAAALVWGWTFGPRGAPAGWTIEDSQLTVTDRFGREVFTFDPGVAVASPDAATLRAMPSLIELADLEGDGRVETVYAARTHDRSPPSAIYILNDDGSTRARVQPRRRSVKFGDITYAAPWLPWGVWVHTNPDGQRSVYAAFIHGKNFPTVLLELDPRGNVLAEYWSNGYIHQVQFEMWNDRRVLVVGAASNEWHAASLAVFESGRAQGAAPAGNDYYACQDCPEGTPSYFVSTPGWCLTLATDSSAVVDELWVDAESQIHALISAGDRDSTGNAHANVWYTLGADLIPVEAEVVTHGWLTEHAKWEARGVLDHGFREASDETFFYPVRLWQDGGWIDLPPGRIDW